MHDLENTLKEIMQKLRKIKGIKIIRAISSQVHSSIVFYFPPNRHIRELMGHLNQIVPNVLVEDSREMMKDPERRTHYRMDFTYKSEDATKIAEELETYIITHRDIVKPTTQTF